MKVSLLTGGGSAPYVLSLLSGLISQGITIDFIGNDEMESAEVFRNINVNHFNLRGDQNHNAPMTQKIFRILKYYFRLVKYAAVTDSKLFHIQWLNKFISFDRTVLNVYYKLLGKKLVFTAHNINAGQRDGNDSLLNRKTLKFMYNFVDHIIVHTNKMKLQLIEEFKVREDKITVIPHGILNVVPNTGLTCAQARKKIGMRDNKKLLLFFGNITRYKGLKNLVLALDNLKKKRDDFMLIIAGNIHRNYHTYDEDVQRKIEEFNLRDNIIEKIEFIHDKDVEVYFKAADVLILPYLTIFQSGVPFLAYSFGLPVIATDVGSLREDIIEGETGYICQPENPEDLAQKIDLYFNSDLFKNLKENRIKIIAWANEKYSWDKIGEMTCEVYRGLI